MVKKSVLLCTLTFVLFACFGITLHSTEAHAANLKDVYSVQITIKESNGEYKWKYHSPRRYEYDTNKRLIKGKEAKKKVEEMMRILDLHEEADVNELVKRLTQSLFPQLERLDIRYMNKEKQHFTWIWEKE